MNEREGGVVRGETRTWKCMRKIGSFLISSRCLTANSRRLERNWSIWALRFSIWDCETWDERLENALVCDCWACSDEMPTERRLVRPRHQCSENEVFGKTANVRTDMLRDSAGLWEEGRGSVSTDRAHARSAVALLKGE